MDKLQAKWERKWEREAGKFPTIGEHLKSPHSIRSHYVLGGYLTYPSEVPSALGWHLLYEENKKLKADVKEMKAIIEEGVENWMSRLSDV